jgi:hypothetical protein
MLGSTVHDLVVMATWCTQFVPTWPSILKSVRKGLHKMSKITVSGPVPSFEMDTCEMRDRPFPLSVKLHKFFLFEPSSLFFFS